MRARSIMMLGTSSHVGKSLVTAALCRIFSQDGYRVAPFKSQNMSLNSAVTYEGLEIGRAQALQAEAANVLPSVHMNPILLKPCGNMTSQIVVHGKIWGSLSATDYHLRRVDELFPLVCQSYETLASQNDIVVLEGAGSPAEINLKQQDIVNMRMADFADASCVLIGDIDRGGVFASLLGTIELLEPHERSRIAGFIINKFRGDIKLLEPGIRMIEDRLGKRCLGVVPYLPGLSIDEEDSLGLPELDSQMSADSQTLNDPSRPLRIAVVALPSFSNFTDFDALRAEPSVSLRLYRTPDQLSNADIIIIPGSKQTADDLRWMRDQHIHRSVLDHAGRGLVVGICGGMQILGTEIADPHNMESVSSICGLGLLAIRTSMRPHKTTRISSGRIVASTLFGQPLSSSNVKGYEIHIGDTEYLKGSVPFAHLSSEGDDPDLPDGCTAISGNAFGTYLHGIFDDDDFRHTFLAAARAFYKLAPPDRLNNWKQRREESLNRLADAVRNALDLPSILDAVDIASSTREQVKERR
jgi:adenosylcobyric acid synthase